MAFDPKPSSWLDNWSEDGTHITLPIASLPQLTAAEADADTGDIRKVLFALCEKLWNEWNARAVADRPSQMTISKSASTSAGSGLLTHTYTLRFVNEISAQDVDDEPA